MADHARGLGSKRLRQAIADGLRMASADLADARLLHERGQPRNCALVLQHASGRIVVALALAELREQRTSLSLDDISDDCPMKERVAKIVSKLAQATLSFNKQVKPPASAQRALADALRQSYEHLEDLAKHFEVDLKSIDPAGYGAPPRPPPPPTLEVVQPRLVTKDLGKKTATPKLPLSVETTQKPEPKPVHATEPPPAKLAAKPKRSKRPARAKAEAKAERRSPLQDKPASHAPEIAPPHFRVRPALTLTSSYFWDLMADWKVSDLDALDLIGHTGGLTKQGKRPRFRLSSDENERLALFKNIDDSLRSAGLEPMDWLRKPIPKAPFYGEAPIQLMVTRGKEGAREASRYILQQGLRLSLGVG